MHILGVTEHPSSTWVTQVARNLVDDLTEHGCSFRFLIRDRDTKFTATFDDVFASIGVEIIRTPVRSPKANAFFERWVRTVRAECLDQTLIMSSRRLARVLAEYVPHYNGHRPHRGLGLGVPTHVDHSWPGSATGGIVCHDVLGGLLHEYERMTA